MDLLYPRRRPKRDLILSESFDCYDAFHHGDFQLRMIVLVTSALVALNCHALVLPVIARDVEHWCKQPSDSNISLADWRDQFLPVKTDGRLSSCYVYKYPNGTDEADAIPCQEWEYGNGSETSVASLWNLVCHRRVLLIASQAVQNFGSVVFAAVAGPFADYIGRVPVIFTAVCVLLASTIGSCVVTSYVTYTILRFVCSGSVFVHCLISIIGLFEVTTHDRRPLDVVFVGTLGYLLSDLWVVVTILVELRWEVKQAIFLAPTLLSLGAFFVAEESPRWLVATGNLDAAEHVMLEGAKLNRFPLASTASLMVKLREQVNDRSHERIGPDEDRALDECSIQRRMLIMIVSQFSLSFTLYTVIFSVPRDRAVLRWESFVMLLLVYAMMHLLITRVAMVRVIRLCFLMLGGILCLMSVVVAIQPTIIVEGLAALSRAFASVAYVVSAAYALELFPTAVRASAICWTFAAGRVGAVCASIFFVLQQAGRRDAAFFMAGCTLFWSLLALHYLPRATGVECAKTEARRAANQRERFIDHMKKTLQPLSSRRGSTSSIGSSRLSARLTKAGSRASSRRYVSRRSMSR